MDYALFCVQLCWSCFISESPQINQVTIPNCSQNGEFHSAGPFSRVSVPPWGRKGCWERGISNSRLLAGSWWCQAWLWGVASHLLAHSTASGLLAKTNRKGLAERSQWKLCCCLNHKQTTTTNSGAIVFAFVFFSFELEDWGHSRAEWGHL